MYGTSKLINPSYSSTILKLAEPENEEDETKSYFLDSDNPKLPDQQFDDVIQTIRKVNKFFKQ